METSSKKLPEDEFDALVQQIQEQSYQDVRNAYGEKGFERWLHPQFNGPMANADCHALLTGKCGDTIQLFLKFKDNVVENASYLTNGCASSMLSGSFTAELAMGCDPDQLFNLQPSDVTAKIGRLPEDDSHCANLAIEVLHECVNSYLINNTEKNIST